MRRKKFTLGFLIAITSYLFLVSAQENKPYVGYRLVHPDKIESKNFYFTLLLNESSELKDIFAADGTLSKIAKEKYLQLTKSEDTPTAISNALKFTEGEIKLIADRLAEFYEKEQALKELYKNHIVASGCYYLLVNKSSEAESIKKIWEQDAKAMNRIIDVYGIGAKPYYPGIDSISYPVNGKKHQELMLSTKSLIVFEPEDNSLFYHIPYLASEVLLDINDRDEAVVYEPLWKNDNRAAYERIKTINWDDYPYSALVVLGSGPDNYDFPLNPGGKIRLRIAAEKYKEGIAPFIIVTGGKVYPFKTRNVEAYHMKQYLMDRFNIPENNIIIEPHARHTTSNIRNTSRIIIRNGIPTAKPMLVTSSERHINSVSSDAFAERCKRELGLVPYVLKKRVSAYFVELYPQLNALQINPIEPLDP